MRRQFELKKRTQFLILALFVGLYNSSLTASPSPKTVSIFDQMSYQEVLDVQLTFNMDELMENRRNDENHPATLSFKDAEGKAQEWNLKLKIRGKFRRIHCSEVPPLKLKFKKKHLREAGLAEFDDMKLVTYCIEDKEKAKEFLLREFLAYKLYNQLSDASFRVQLLNITYLDPETGSSRQEMGFLIEDTAQLRDRINADKSSGEFEIDPTKFETVNSRKAALFQYLIGNLDWAITRSKNVKYVVKEEKIIPVPYDFDFSAIVKASYARINADVGQTKVGERIYLGFEKDDASLQATIDFFASRKKSLYSTIKNFDLLKSKSRREMQRYLQSFFIDRNSLQFKKEVIAQNAN